MPKQFLNTSKTSFTKPRKWILLTWKWLKQPPNKAKIWHTIFILEVISTIQAENTTICGAFTANNNAQTTSEHLKINFEKSQKWLFFCLKNCQITDINFVKSADFFLYFGTKSFNIVLKVLMPILKSFLLQAEPYNNTSLKSILNSWTWETVNTLHHHHTINTTLVPNFIGLPGDPTEEDLYLRYYIDNLLR